MKSLFTRRSLFILCLFIACHAQLFAQSISGSTTICPNTGTVRYTFSPASGCNPLWGNIQGGPVTVVGGGGSNNYLDLQFPSVPSDVTYIINAGYNCGGSTTGNATLSVLVKRGPAIETRSTVIPCNYSTNYTFEIDLQIGSWTEVQWSTNTGWLSGSQSHSTGSNGIQTGYKSYGVNNINAGYVKAVVLGTQCNNAPIEERTYNITRTPDASLPAPVFTTGSPTAICGSTATTVSVTPPALAPSGYRWYSVPANALKINGGFYNSDGAALLTTTPSVSIQAANTQSVNATIYVSAVYPGGCNTAAASRQLSVAPGIASAPEVWDDLISGPGEPTMYEFTARPALSGVTYNWYVNGSLITATTDWFRRYVPCRATITVYCTVTNSCGTSAPSGTVNAVGGCRETRLVNFTISPNPATNIVSITLKNSAAAKSAEPSAVDAFNEVSIFDFSGNLVKRQQYARVRQGTIDVGSLRTGTYYIEIKNGQYVEKQTLIIQK